MTAITRSPSPRQPDDQEASAVKTLRKALAILDAFAAAEMPLTVAEVAIRSGITRPTAYRLVQTLIAQGYLAQNPRDGRISPGYSVLRLAGRLLDADQMRLEALPHLETLARDIGERANLGILHRDEVLYLAGVEKPSLPTIYSRFGKVAPAYCSSLGKAILALLPPDRLDSYLGQVHFEAKTANTITDEASLRVELAGIRKVGYAVDREEHVPGLFCVASAILFDGLPVGAIGVTGRALAPIEKQAGRVQHTAEVISHILRRSF